MLKCYFKNSLKICLLALPKAVTYMEQNEVNFTFCVVLFQLLCSNHGRGGKSAWYILRRKKELLSQCQRCANKYNMHISVLDEENNVYFSIPCSIYPKDHCPT